jgi:ribonucleoside-diphosphate reductase alpha chain
MFEREEVYNSTLKYFNGDAIATDVWINKYALKDSDGNLYEQNPDDMHLRLAKELARIEKKYPNPLTEEHIFSLLKDFKYIIPQGGSMAGIGNNRQIASLSNCFVVGEPKWDSYGAICKTDQELVQISKRRGGIGTDLTGLRPAKSAVNNSALNSTGIVPFAERYSNSIREVAQDGRRGALMLTLGIEHPDEEDFIDAKM